MNPKTAAIFVVILLAASSVAIWFAYSGNENDEDTGENGETITVTDMEGREVVMTLPVTRVAITSSDLVDVLASVAGEGWEELLVMWPEDMVSREPSKYDLYMESCPSLADLPACPDLFSGNLGHFPCEEIAVTEPDVVLVNKETMDWLQINEESYRMLTHTGIAVVYLDFINGIFEGDKCRNNLEILGQILQQEDRADAIADYFEEQVKTVNELLDAIPESEKGKTIYFEIPGTSATEYGITPGSNTPEQVYLGAVNVTTELGLSYSIISREQLASIDPDYICFCMSTYYGSQESALFGYNQYTDEETLSEMSSAFLSRAGWSELNAVKNGDVLFYYAEFRCLPAGFVNIQVLAKLMYPEYFEDIDPLENLEGYFEEFMPFEIDGTWAYQISA
ncbi:MAG: ABC transporter substrate-binding protein [Gudongella sp.]|nr:ABC transporter substrate-binding protein [Gudongella sp.]